MTKVVPLSDLRNQIDSIDRQILQLINQRATVAIEVAKTKMAAGEEECFYRPDRESMVLRKIREANQGPMDDDSAARFFRELMSVCLSLEKPVQVSYLGPEGTFTQQAAFKHFGHAVQTVPSTTIDEIFRAVENNQTPFGVVPVENSTEGIISNTLDRFVISPLQICGEVSIRVHHNLMGNISELSEIEEVFSHQQSFSQCRKWLERNLGKIKLTAVSSNAEGARMAVNNKGTAAIAGEIAADLYQLNLLERNIEDELDNTTRFLIIGQQTTESTGNDKTTLLISTGNQSGALHRILEPFAHFGISLTRIESRPSRQGVWDYVFFVDIQGHKDDEQVSEAIATLKNSVNMVKILGSYPKAVL